ncbi:MAG: hypothetical protein ACOCV2_09665 [Persicimonas sp.]
MNARRIRMLITSLVVHLVSGRLSQEGYEPPSRPPNQSDGGGSGDASGMAVATLLLGIGAWTILPVVGAVGGAALGWFELKNIERGESPQAGKTITQVGFWLSVAQIVLSVLGTCVAVAAAIFIFGGFGAMMAAAGG